MSKLNRNSSFFISYRKKTMTGVLMTMAVQCAGLEAGTPIGAPVDQGYTGISNLVVGSNVFNVTFLEGVCSDLFGGCNDSSDFTFSNLTDAYAAAEAIKDVISATTAWEMTPHYTYGISNSNPGVFSSGHIVIPFMDGSLQNASVYLDHYIGYGYSVETRYNLLPPEISLMPSTNTQGVDLVWAQFVPVPEPSTSTFLVSAVALLNAKRRRKSAPCRQASRPSTLFERRPDSCKS